MKPQARPQLQRIEDKLDRVIELATSTAARCPLCMSIVLGDEAHQPIAERVGAVETTVATLAVRREIAAKIAWTLIGGLVTLFVTVGGTWAAAVFAR